jgi:hypothetical protein
MEIMIHILVFIETLISIYWLFNGIYFQQAKDMYTPENDCMGCFISSFISIFLHLFDWIFLTFTLHNLNKVITDPIDGVLKPTNRIRIYVIVALLASGLSTVLSYMSKVFGRSVSLLINLSQ